MQVELLLSDLCHILTQAARTLQMVVRVCTPTQAGAACHTDLRSALTVLLPIP